MKKSTFIYLLMPLLAFGIFGCGSDDDPKVEEELIDPIDIEDPNAVAESLTFQNGTATKVSSSFPESSNESGSPKINQYDEDLIAVSGGSLALRFNEETTSDIKGVYLQVDGADHYYDIAINQSKSNGRLNNGRKSKAKGQRTKAESVSFLLVSFADGLQPGDLCIKYAVYDEGNRVSNTINVCIEIKSHGGKNSSFLTANKWEFESEHYVEIYEGETYEETTVLGEPYLDSYYWSCFGDSVGVEITEEYTLNSMVYTFSKNGKVEGEFSDTEKYVDTDDYCETKELKYVTKTEEYTISGNWVYDDTKKELTTVTQHTETYGGYEEIYTDVSTVKVSQDNGKLILRYENPDWWGSETIVTVLKPKK